MDADVGHGIHPLTAGGVERAEGGEFQAVKEVLFDVAHAVLNPPFFIGFTHLTGDGGEAIMSGKVQIARIKARGHARQVLPDTALQVIDHHLGGAAAKELQGVAVAGQELFHALGESELEINHAAVTEHHDKEGQAPTGGADGNGTVAAPIDLGTFAGRKGQHQESGLAHRADQANKRLEDAVAPSIALGPKLLEHLLGGVRVTFQQPNDLAFEGVQFAGPLGAATTLVTGARHPLGHRLGVQSQFRSDLGNGQVLLVRQFPQLAENRVTDHGAPPARARRRMSATD